MTCVIFGFYVSFGALRTRPVACNDERSRIQQMKTAVIFLGQGSPKVGMGKMLAESFPRGRAVFEEADRVLGARLSSVCFEGPEEELMLTAVTQPAILTTSIAAFRVAESAGLRADFVAGHSLGEYSALVAAGSLDFCQAVELVRQRGRFMQ